MPFVLLLLGHGICDLRAKAMRGVLAEWGLLLSLVHSLCRGGRLPGNPGNDNAMPHAAGVGGHLAPHKVRQEKKTKKTANVRTYFIWPGSRIELLYTCDDVFFLIAFLSSPHRETPKNAPKKSLRGKRIRRTTP
jgi:hypothetical protein